MISLSRQEAHRVILPKPNERYSLNGLYFLDRRKVITGEFTEQVHNLVKELTGEIPIVNHLATNETLFFDEPFNDPENYWWRMHIDGGYNLIIYMSKGGDSCGTNFYDRDDFLNYDKFYAACTYANMSNDAVKQHVLISLRLWPW